MTRRVDVEREATVDISQAALRYEEKRAGLGLEFLNRFEAVIERIEENPRQFPLIDGTIRRALLARFPYAVYFRAVGDRSVIRAVLHLHRHPDTWKR